MEGRGEIPHVETRTDSLGREQPAHRTVTVGKITHPAEPRTIEVDKIGAEADTMMVPVMCPQGCGPSKINFRNTSPGSSLCERDRLPRLPDSCPLAIWNYSQISSCKSVPPPLRLPLHQPTPLNPALKEFSGRVL
ncbi:MAG TPA: hypothetical protein VFP79_07160 [Pseudolabrys sp.]|nr:hypothetical protein [Pseudolabrys sp.]